MTSVLRRIPLLGVATTASERTGALRLAGRLLSKRSGAKSTRVITTRRAAVLGGVIAGAAGFSLRRRRGDPGSGAGPGLSSRPPTDTAPPVPTVDASAEPLGIDEDAEVRAAGAEAANIGGPEIDDASAGPDMTAADEGR